MTTTTKPKFQDLTPEQVNDLIATKVMGYTLDHIAPTNGKKYTVSGTNPDGYSWMGSIIFDWFHSHDDCWKAQEKIRGVLNLPEGNYIECLCAAMEESYDDFDISTATRLLHATAAQKCEAMIRAIGEVE